MVFSFLSSLLCTPTDKRTIQKHFSWKIFFLNNFFLNKGFLHYSWKTSLIIFTEPFEMRCSWKYFSITKKTTRKTVSRFLALALCTPSDNNFIQNSYSRKHLFYIFFPIFLIIILRVYNHWWIIPNQSIFFQKTSFSDNLLSAKYICSSLSTVLWTPTDENVVQKKFMKSFTLKLSFLKEKVFFNFPVELQW